MNQVTKRKLTLGDLPDGIRFYFSSEGDLHQISHYGNNIAYIFNKMSRETKCWNSLHMIDLLAKGDQSVHKIRVNQAYVNWVERV